MSTPNVNSPASSTQPTQQQGTPSDVTAPDGGYPEQKHAGAVGLGPEYGKGASGFDKLHGLREELVGKVLHNPQKVQHGHDLRTGELLKKQHEEEEKKNPFQSVKDDDKKKDEAPPQSATAGKQQHPTSQGAKEQAATIAPEGTEDAERQRQGQVNPKSIG